MGKIDANSLNPHMVAIILVNWKNYDDTKDCLNSLHPVQDTPSFSIIVVDNESQETPVAENLKRKLPAVSPYPTPKNKSGLYGSQ